MRILFISQWYPNRYDTMAGLFVRKHAEAVSLYCDVRVLYVHADKKINRFEVEKRTNNSLTEYILYYPAGKNSILGKTTTIINYFIAYHKGLKMLNENNWKPDIIQANIFTRTALVACLMKLKYRIPFVVIEHWTRYFREKTFNNFLHRLITVWVAGKAAAVLPVTKHLQEWMQYHGIKNNNYQIINNVCEDIFFSKATKQDNQKVRILNVTCFNDNHKNISGILRVISELSKKRHDFELILIGDGDDLESMKAYARELKIKTGYIQFTGLLEGEKLVEQYQQCDFTVLFSNFENIPVVISESLACGKPVISTNVGGINEHITPENGILIPAKDEKALLESIDRMIDNYKQYDAKKITDEAYEKYSYNEVGKKLLNIYLQIVE
ncbi:MAG: glycosyl transferase group 1 [Bacteroidetes bacterium]|nr:glycosyl transferase group 1 [Bacteroidota bacterium]